MDFTLTTNVFPNGTLVKAYPKSNWSTPGAPSGAPVGAAASEQTRSSDRLTFTGLTTGVEYWAVASVGGTYRYVGFTAGADESLVADRLQTSDIGAAGEAGKVLASDDPAVVKNAKHYGAVGNGAADDTIALQAAIDASVGGRLHIPAGRYRLTASLLLPSNIILEGDGDQATALVGTWTAASGESSKGWTYVRNAKTDGTAENITVRNIGIDGAGDGTASGTPVGGVVTGLLFRRVKGVRVYNCRAYRVPGISIAYQGCERVRIIGNEVNQGGRDGITGMWYTDDLLDVVVADNLIKEVGDDGIAIGASGDLENNSERARRISVTGNTIYGAGMSDSDAAGRGIWVDGVEDATIAGNVVSDTFAAGISINSDGAGAKFRSRRVTVTGNVVRRAAIWNNATQPLVGIRCVGADACTIANNVVAEAVGDGIYVNDATEIAVSGNTVEGCGSVLLSHFGIHLDGGTGIRNVFHCTVTGNTVKNNTGGIRCNFTQKCPVTANTCVNNGRTGNGTQNNASGIILNGDTTFVATGNVCYDTAGAGSKTQTFGIVLTGGSPTAIINGNYLTGNAGVGFKNEATGTPLVASRGNVASTTAGSATNFDQDISGAKVFSGTGTPEGNVEAPVGSIFRRTDGGAATSFYVKESTTGKTGWVAK